MPRLKHCSGRACACGPTTSRSQKDRFWAQTRWPLLPLLLLLLPLAMAFHVLTLLVRVHSSRLELY
jgi:hypothetical protein